MQQFSAEERNEIEAGSAVLINETRVYAALRNAYTQTHEEVGKELSLSPEHMDRVAHQSLLFIKKMQEVFARHGGVFALTAELADIAKVDITDIEDIL